MFPVFVNIFSLKHLKKKGNCRLFPRKCTAYSIGKDVRAALYFGRKKILELRNFLRERESDKGGVWGHFLLLLL
jgi:hypothetical protein